MQDKGEFEMKKKRWGILFAGMLACLTVSLQANAASGIAIDRKSTRLNSSHNPSSRMPSSA